VARHRDEPRHEADDGVVLRVGRRLLLPHHPDAGVDEEDAEDVDDPVEAFDERGAECDHRHAHDERAHHAPEEYPVLVLRRHLEVAEDEQEDEEVIDRERQLDDVAGQKLGARQSPLVPEDESGEHERQRHPDGAPRGGLAVGDGVGLAVQHAEVEGQHEQDEDGETRPGPDRVARPSRI
jgi:hypothetical protein